MVKSSFTARFRAWLNEWSDAKTRQVLIVVLAVLLGLLLGMVVDTIMRNVGNYIFPPPPILDMADPEQLRELYKTMPVEAYIIKIFSWAIGTLAGGYCAVRVSKMGQFPAWMVGILLFAGYLIGLQPWALPNPLWVLLLCPVLVGACAWGGGWLGMYVTVQKELRAQAKEGVGV